MLKKDGESSLPEMALKEPPSGKISVACGAANMLC